MNIDSLLYCLNPVKEKGRILSYIALREVRELERTALHKNYTNVISDEDYRQLKLSMTDLSFFDLFKNETILNNDGGKVVLEIEPETGKFAVFTESSKYVYITFNKKDLSHPHCYFVPESSVHAWIDLWYKEVTPQQS